MSTLRLAIHGPYDTIDIEPTIQLLRAARANAVVVLSHMAHEHYERLAAELPGDAQWIIRVKTGAQHLGAVQHDGTLDWREWTTEHSLREALDYLTRIIAPDQQRERIVVTLGCEPDLEIAREPVDVGAHMTEAMWTYEQWARRLREAIMAEYPDVTVTYAPLSQGSPPRFGAWLSYLHPRYAETDALAIHLYSNGLEPGADDWSNWGGQWAVWQAALPSRRTLVTELNANGPSTPEHLARLVADLAQHEIETAALFLARGGADDAQRPDWWFRSLDDAAACRAALDAARVEPEPEPIIQEDHAMTIDEAKLAALRDLWGPAAPLVPGTAIGDAWLAAPGDHGTCLGPERPAGDGSTYQAFALRVVRWDPETNAVETVA